jgi:hypothetical protein
MVICRYLRRRAFLRLVFLKFDARTVDHFNPPSLYTPRDQAFRDNSHWFSLYHDLLQVRIVNIRLYGCRRRACHLQPLSEVVCIKAENLEAGYVSDRMVLAANDVDRDRVRFAFPR